MPSIITWLIHQFLTKDQHEYSLLSLRLWVIFIATFQVIWFWWANVFFLLLLPGWVKMNNCFFLRSLRPLRILWENISSFLPFSHKSYIYHYQPSSPHASSLSFCRMRSRSFLSDSCFWELWNLLLGADLLSIPCLLSAPIIILCAAWEDVAGRGAGGWRSVQVGSFRKA